MIHYALRCAAGHDFEGWFNHSRGFEEQRAAHLVSCPHCGDSRVEQALMAPAIVRHATSRKTEQVIPPASPEAPTQSGAASGEAMPDALRAALQKLRREVEAKCDDVGDAFAAEARRMHKGDIPTRAIYGNASPDERESLADDGIAITTLPWIGRADS